MGETVYLNGAFVAKQDAHLSPDDRGFLFGDGVYEVIRSYRGRLFAAVPHLERLDRGLRALRIGGADPASLERVIEELLVHNGLRDADATVYVQVTRGVAPRKHAFPSPAVPPTVYLSAQPFTPRYDAAKGVKVVTAPDVRWARCDIKTVMLVPNCLANQAAADAGADEAVLVRDGVALEGTHTSFFGVIGGVVRTAPKSNYILPSITRDVTIRLCRQNAIALDESPIFADELPNAEELFLAGTTVEIMPIVACDGRPVGTGKPGPIARRLWQLFRGCV